MDQARVHVAPAPGAPVSPRLFGGLVEHLGRTIYGGVWDLDRQVARADVQAAIRALDIAMLRWPGGCFSAWYHWADGVGLAHERPVHERTVWTDMAGVMGPEGAAEMGPRETNRFGTDEFLQYCLDIPCEPLLVANLGGGMPPGEGTPEEAAAWVRYCNVDRRAPRPVQWWAIGNETWGPHELGHCSAAEYATRYGTFTEQMLAVDPSLQFVASGVCPDQYGLGASGLWDGWNAGLTRSGAPVDALSLHWYFPGMIGRQLRDDERDYRQVATGADDLERILATVRDEVGVPLALDEWGQMASLDDHLGVEHRLSDAVFFAGCWNAMLRHADRVSMAMIAGLVNVLAPIQTRGDRHFVTSAYLVALLYRRAAGASARPVEVEGPTMDVPAMQSLERAMLASTMARTDRTSAVIDASAVSRDGATTVYLTNRSIDTAVRITVDGLGSATAAQWRWLTGPDLFARNDVDHPDVLRFAERAVDVSGGDAVVEIPPATTGALMVEGSRG